MFKTSSISRENRHCLCSVNRINGQLDIITTSLSTATNDIFPAGKATQSSNSQASGRAENRSVFFLLVSVRLVEGVFFPSHGGALKIRRDIKLSGSIFSIDTGAQCMCQPSSARLSVKRCPGCPGIEQKSEGFFCSSALPQHLAQLSESIHCFHEGRVKQKQILGKNTSLCQCKSRQSTTATGLHAQNFPRTNKALRLNNRIREGEWCANGTDLR